MPTTRHHSATQIEPTSAEAKTERLAARLSADQKQVLEHAAALAHQPVSQFLVASAMNAAQQIIKEHELLLLSARESQAIMQALLHPEPAGPDLKRLAQDYEMFMKQGA